MAQDQRAQRSRGSASWRFIESLLEPKGQDGQAVMTLFWQCCSVACKWTVYRQLVLNVAIDFCHIPKSLETRSKGQFTIRIVMLSDICCTSSKRNAVGQVFL